MSILDMAIYTNMPNIGVYGMPNLLITVRDLCTIIFVVFFYPNRYHCHQQRFTIMLIKE